MGMCRCKSAAHASEQGFGPVGMTESALAWPSLDRDPGEGPIVCATAQRRAMGIAIGGVKTEIPA